MKEFIKLFSDLYLLIAGATVILMITNAWGGLVIANFKDKIDWKMLVQSLIKYLGILIMAGLMYIAFKLGGEALSIGIGSNIPIEEIISLGLISILVKYGKDCLSKWETLTNIKLNHQDEKEKQLNQLLGEKEFYHKEDE